MQEPSTLKVRLTTVSTEKNVPELRILLTSDWHVSPIVSERQLDFLSEAIAEAKPDLILLQGDLVDSPLELKRDTSLKKLMLAMKTCAKAAPTLMVLGNHDIATPGKEIKVMKNFALPRWEVLAKKCGVKLLLNEWANFQGVRFFGAFQDTKSFIRTNPKTGELQYHEDWKVYEKEIEKYDFSNLSKTEFNWFIAHAPMLTDTTLERLAGFDILSFGHTHGGIIPRGIDEVMEKTGMHTGILHPNQRLITKYLRGTIHLKTGNIAVVTPGMSGFSFCTPRVLHKLNFIKAAEMNVIELKPTEAEE